MQEKKRNNEPIIVKRTLKKVNAVKKVGEIAKVVAAAPN